MVTGLDIFRERFRQFEGAFTLIGGAACDEWFTAQGLAFRATKDLDIVLMIEVLDQRFVAAMRSFVTEGGYEIRERSEGVPMLADRIVGDLAGFLRAFPANSADWPAILASLKGSLGGGLRADALLNAIRTYFQLPTT